MPRTRTCGLPRLVVGSQHTDETSLEALPQRFVVQARQRVIVGGQLQPSLYPAGLLPSIDQIALSINNISLADTTMGEGRLLAQPRYDEVSTSDPDGSAISMVAAINARRHLHHLVATAPRTQIVWPTPSILGRCLQRGELIINKVIICGELEAPTVAALVDLINQHFKDYSVIARVEQGGGLQLSCPDGRNLHLMTHGQSQSGICLGDNFNLAGGLALNCVARGQFDCMPEESLAPITFGGHSAAYGLPRYSLPVLELTLMQSPSSSDTSDSSTTPSPLSHPDLTQLQTIVSPRLNFDSGPAAPRSRRPPSSQPVPQAPRLFPEIPRSLPGEFNLSVVNGLTVPTGGTPTAPATYAVGELAQPFTVVFDHLGRVIPNNPAAPPQPFGSADTSTAASQPTGIVQTNSDLINITYDDGPITFSGPNLLTQSVTFDLNESTQNAVPFSISEITQDGYTTGRLTRVEVDPDGIIVARFANGRTDQIGQVAFSTAPGTNGLGEIAAQVVSGGRRQQTHTPTCPNYVARMQALIIELLQLPEFNCYAAQAAPTATSSSCAEVTQRGDAEPCLAANAPRP